MLLLSLKNEPLLFESGRCENSFVDYKINYKKLRYSLRKIWTDPMFLLWKDLRGGWSSTMDRYLADVISGGNRIFCGGLRGQNTILRGQKSKNLPKVADFGHFFLLTGGGQGGEPPTGGGNAPIPPWCRHWMLCEKPNQKSLYLKWGIVRIAESVVLIWQFHWCQPVDA